MNNATAPMPTDSLARLVRQKRRLLEQLAALGERQGRLINDGDAAGLVELLSGKQQLIAGLQVVEHGLDAFRNDDPESRVWPTSQARAECKTDADACNRLLAGVIATEQAHEGLMNERRDAIGVQLRQAQSAHAASAAYKPHLRAPRAMAPRNPADAPLQASLDLTAGS